MNRYKRRYSFEKKADSLDITRYGLWGDAPAETFIFFAVLFIYSISGMIVARIQCLTHTLSPEEYRISSLAQILPESEQLATSTNPSAYLRAILLTVPDVPYRKQSNIATSLIFATSESSQGLIVSAEENSEGYFLELEKYSGISLFPPRVRKPSYVNAFYAHSDEVMNYVFTSGKVFHECYDPPYSIVVDLPYIDPTSMDKSLWDIVFVRDSYYLTGKMARIAFDPELRSFEVICNDNGFFAPSRPCNLSNRKGD